MGKKISLIGAGQIGGTLAHLLGLKEESKKYAVLLGYNYQSSQWYEKSYAIFDKIYELNKKENEIKKRKQNSLLKKFKSLFE